jgi:hypothetical protein
MLQVYGRVAEAPLLSKQGDTTGLRGRSVSVRRKRGVQVMTSIKSRKTILVLEKVTASMA